MIHRVLSIFLFSMLIAGAALAADLVEPASKTAFPETVVLGEGEDTITLHSTGAGIRTKWRFKAYACASYIDGSAEIGADLADALIHLDAAKQLNLAILRDFGVGKVTGAFKDGFEKNNEDLMNELSEEVERFLAFFKDDPRDGDTMLFTYVPGIGTTASHNDAILGTIEDARFAELVWGIYFGDDPVSGKLKEGMLGERDD